MRKCRWSQTSKKPEWCLQKSSKPQEQYCIESGINLPVPAAELNYSTKTSIFLEATFLSTFVIRQKTCTFTIRTPLNVYCRVACAITFCIRKLQNRKQTHARKKNIAACAGEDSKKVGVGISSVLGKKTLENQWVSF